MVFLLPSWEKVPEGRKRGSLLLLKHTRRHGEAALLS